MIYWIHTVVAGATLLFCASLTIAITILTKGSEKKNERIIK
jgi:hypothetical protein